MEKFIFNQDETRFVLVSKIKDVYLKEINEYLFMIFIDDKKFGEINDTEDRAKIILKEIFKFINSSTDCLSSNIYKIPKE